MERSRRLDRGSCSIPVRPLGKFASQGLHMHNDGRGSLLAGHLYQKDLSPIKYTCWDSRELEYQSFQKKM